MSVRRAIGSAARRVTARYLIAIAALLLAGILVATLVSNGPAPAPSGPALTQPIEDELDAAIPVDPVQPPSELIELIEQQPARDDAGVKTLSAFSEEEYPYRPRNVVMKDHLPFFEKKGLREDPLNVLHPMNMGSFLLRNAQGLRATESLEAALSVAYELPNQGLAWYYPRHYDVQRMRGDNLKYSSISQGTILAGLTGMAEMGVADFSFANSTFKALLWPFERGGVNLADRAVLEMPSFSGPPELILNGWLDALLHIRDYGEISEDEEAIDFFVGSVSFLAEVLPNFDSREAGISRYSDVSPYRVKVRLASPDDVDSLQVLYRPSIEGVPAIRVDLNRTENPDDFSPYENQILRQNGREALVWLSCSQLYETVLVSTSSEMSAELSTGRIDRNSTTPGFSGETIRLGSQQAGGHRVITFSEEDGLICGYPTNFSKGSGYNAYHVYHVVGLMLVALSEEVSDADRRTLLEWAFKWKSDIPRIEREEGLTFQTFDKMLTGINANQTSVTYVDFSTLLADAEAVLAE